MEQRLYRIIMRPAMIVAWGAGLILIWMVGGWQVWLVVKLLSVVAMSAFHELLGRYVRAFAVDERPGSERFFRMINEVPTGLMVIIVVSVVVKPFS
jgi:putative membrane protein